MKIFFKDVLTFALSFIGHSILSKYIDLDNIVLDFVLFFIIFLIIYSLASFIFSKKEESQ